MLHLHMRGNDGFIDSKFPQVFVETRVVTVRNQDTVGRPVEGGQADGGIVGEPDHHLRSRQPEWWLPDGFDDFDKEHPVILLTQPAARLRSSIAMAWLAVLRVVSCAPWNE